MTDWALVAVGLVAMAAGAAFFRFAEPVSRLQRSLMRSLHYPRAVQRSMTADIVRMIGGVGFFLMGVLAVVVGGFFAQIL